MATTIEDLDNQLTELKHARAELITSMVNSMEVMQTTSEAAAGFEDLKHAFSEVIIWYSSKLEMVSLALHTGMPLDDLQSSMDSLFTQLTEVTEDIKGKTHLTNQLLEMSTAALAATKELSPAQRRMNQGMN